MERRRYRRIRKLRTGLQTLASSTDHQTGGQFASKSIPQQERIPTMMSTVKELEEASAVVIHTCAMPGDAGSQTSSNCC